MEVDPPVSSGSSSTPTNTSGPHGQLKRSNSAPMINILGVEIPTSEAKPPSACSTPPPISSSSLSFRSYERVRRFSTSSMALCSPTTPVKVPSRLHQIKREETMPADREVAHEREFQSTMQMSQSWEELTLQDGHEKMMTDTSKSDTCSLKRPKSLGEPLHIFTSSYTAPYVSSPSPTRDRVGKQCFSPSLQQHVRNNTLTPSPSPSPTRKTFAGARRSLSPTVHALRPSPLGGALKRKMESDWGDKPESYFSPPKRFHSSHSPGNSTPERLNLPCHPLIHSISSSSLSDNSSPEQRVPNVSSSASSVNFVNQQVTTGPFSFRPVHTVSVSQETETETSDINTAMQVSQQEDSSKPHMDESR